MTMTNPISRFFKKRRERKEARRYAQSAGYNTYYRTPEATTSQDTTLILTSYDTGMDYSYTPSGSAVPTPVADSSDGSWQGGGFTGGGGGSFGGGGATSTESWGSDTSSSSSSSSDYSSSSSYSSSSYDSSSSYSSSSYDSGSSSSYSDSGSSGGSDW
jgi:hypothetical protein